jgi:antitoxin ParD1/3/4
LKIVTVNVPESYIDAIEKLVGENGLYPSRSELIRVAVREFLLREMEMAKNIHKITNKAELDEFDNKKYIKIPVDKVDLNEPVREFKTYKVIRRLED